MNLVNKKLLLKLYSTSYSLDIWPLAFKYYGSIEILMPLRNHTVEFYSDDHLLVDSVAAFIQKGDAAIVICTPSHKSLLEKKIGNSISCQYFDAEETLAKFMIGKQPDAERFNKVVGSIVEASLEKHKDVRAFGEMVAILWDRGNAGGALLLEELWNDLLRKNEFSLHCAYPEQSFDSRRAKHDIDHVCNAHTASTLSNITFIT